MAITKTHEQMDAEWFAWQKKQADAAGMSVVDWQELQREKEAEKENRHQEQDAKLAMDAMKIPLRTRETITNGARYTAALESIWNDVDILVLSGRPGRGKSVSAAIWLLLGGSWFCRWISAGELARGYAYDQQAFDSLVKVNRLVIDDLGTEYQDQKDRYQATLSEIVETRYANKRSTCLTTNLGPDEFKARYGERLTSRIREDGAFVVCGGEDLRGKAP